MAVTAVTGTNQCAETDRIARGRGIEAPTEAHAAVYAFFASAFRIAVTEEDNRHSFAHEV
jgi:hypothetical protein